MNLAHWLARRAALSPTRDALYRGHDLVADYAGFADRARRVAGWLAGQGIKPGDRVAIFMTNVPEYLVAFYGIWMAGAVVVPINAKLHGREARFILEDAGAKFVFATDAQAAGLAGLGASADILRVPGAAFDEILNADPIAEIAHRTGTKTVI